MIALLLSKKIINTSKLWERIGRYGMGIYIFQQFILVTLYYRTALPEYVSIESLPWIGLLTAFVSSYVLTELLLKIKLGCLLLGERISINK